MCNLKVGVINIGIGNVGSIRSAFNFYGYDVDLVKQPEELRKIDVIILAGVGNFKSATSKLRASKFWHKLDHAVRVDRKPVLGICLGMQLFGDLSYENGENKGFGWIKGKVVKIEDKLVKVPHIGWEIVKPLDSKLFEGMRYNSFYFMHSYHFVPEDEDVVIATVGYGGLKIVSGVRKDNLIGVQFHPEKSQGDGLRFLRNFLKVAGCLLRE